MASDPYYSTGKYRRQMKQRFDWKTYHRRSQVETVISMLTRNLGGKVKGQRCHKGQRCQQRSKVSGTDLSIGS